MKIIQRPSLNHTRGRQNWTPDMIVCHITDGTFPGSINWVTNAQSQVSYHFMISRTGEITQCVNIENTAWANGTTNDGSGRDNRRSRLEAVRSRRANANLYTISIGHEGRHSETNGALTPEQLTATTWLIEHIRSEVNRIWNTDIPLTRDNIVGHVCITPRHRPNCPGVQFPFDEIIQRSASVNTTQNNKFLPGHTPSSWAADSWLWAIENNISDGTRPLENITRQEVVQLLRNFHNRFLLKS